MTSAPRRNVLMVTYEFPPSTRVGAHSCEQLSRYLPAYGWDPVVLSANEAYYDSIDPTLHPRVPVIRTRVLPHPLEMYRKSRIRAVRDASAPDSVPEPSHARPRRNIRQFILRMLSVPDVYTGWILPAVVAGWKVCRRSKISAIVSSAPWWTNHLVGLALGRTTGLPWIAHFRDPWTHSPFWRTKGDLAQAMHARLERLVVSKATAVMCVTEQHTNLMRSLYPELPSTKFFTSPNGYDEEEWRDIEAPIKTPNRAFEITYAGSLYEERDPAPVFRAVRRLVDAGAIDIKDINFEFLGAYGLPESQKLHASAVESSLADHINVRGALSRRDAHAAMMRSNLLLLLAENRTLLIPAKAYEYLRAGRPILALASKKSGVADLFARTGGAWIVDQTDDAAIADAILQEYKAWQSGTVVRIPDPNVAREYDRARLSGQLAALLDSVST